MPFGHITTGCPFEAVWTPLSVSHSNSTAFVIVPAASISDQPQKVRPLDRRKAVRLVVSQRWYPWIFAVVVPVRPRAVIWLASGEYEVHCVSPVAVTSSPPQ